MAGDQAGKFKAACAVEGPDDSAFLARVHMRHVGLVVFHAGVLFHHLGMRLELLRRADHDLVQDLAGVHRDQAHGLAPLDLDLVGGKPHVIGHADFNGTGDFFGIACDAPVLLLSRR